VSLDDRFAQDYTDLRRDPSRNRYNDVVTGPVSDWRPTSPT
jgi:hypothetical protein